MARAPETLGAGVAVPGERWTRRVVFRGIATLGPVGRVPLAPGTAGSLVALIAWIAAAPSAGWAMGILVGGLGLLGVAAAGDVARELRHADPSEVVIDEVVGMWLTLALVPAGVLAAAVGFAAFRAFDVSKPFPLRRLERLPGGWGIVADDVAAALYAAAAVRLAWMALG